MNITHDWVDHFEEYEAVLVCTNELPAWDAAQEMRAFAIDQWTDATTKGDTPSLTHNDFGTIIRHDGGVLAIDFGHGSLNDSLPDLFQALHRLGWRGAVVYHPAMSMNELLTDMGRAIPANLEFDIQAAGQKHAIADSPEGKMLVDSAHRLADVDTAIQHDVADDSQVILNTLRDLGEPVEKTKEEHLAEIHAHVGYVEPAAEVSTPLDLANTQVVDDYAPVIHAFDDAPHIDEVQHDEGFDAIQEEDFNGSSYSAPDVPFEAVALSAAASDFNHTVSSDDPGHNFDVMQDEVVAKQVQNKIISPLTPLDKATLNDLNNIKVGHSVFCFDVPGQSLSAENINQIAAEHNISSANVVNLYPGANKAPVRWDFLGEVDLNFPWFVENIVDLMIPNTDKNLVSSIFMAVIKNKPSANLRDILMFAGKEADEMTDMLTAVSPAAALLLNQAKRRGSLDSTLDQVVQCLGGLALNNESFVDVELAMDADYIYKTFTVREIMISPVAQLFIVHVDALDSPFVHAIVNSLQYVATKSSASDRYLVDVAAVAAPVVDDSEVKRKAAAQVLIGSFLEQLQVLGIDLNSVNNKSTNNNLGRGAFDIRPDTPNNEL